MGEVTFFAFQPARELAPFVEVVWGVRAPAVPGAEAVLPTGAVELMVNFGPEQHVVGHGDRVLTQTFRRAWLAGVQDRRLAHSGGAGADHISVRFRPGGAHAFFDLPMSEAANRVIELDELLGPEADALRDRLGALPGDRDRALAFQRWLLGRLRVASTFPTVKRAVELLAQRPDPSPVGAVCDRLGLSNKTLVQHFRRTVGLTPKVVGRIGRFQAVVAACSRSAGPDWNGLAHEFGFADQPHLIREFRVFAGVTPEQFLARRSADGSAVLVA